MDIDVLHRAEVPMKKAEAFLLRLFVKTNFIKSRNDQEKPENKGAGIRPHPCFQVSFNFRVLLKLRYWQS
jgi:hypothetical protein